MHDMLPTDTSYTSLTITHLTTAMFPLTSSGFVFLPFVFFLAGRSSSSSEADSCEQYVADKLLAMHANQPGNCPLPNTSCKTHTVVIVVIVGVRAKICKQVRQAD